MALQKLIDDLTVDTPQVFQDVEIVPLLSAREPAPFLELDDALETGVAEIVEMSDSGSVPELNVINKSQRDIVIFDGEQLIGAKQNRIVNITVIVPANSTLPIPVSCVEQGRWRYTSRKFATGAAFAYPSLRVSKHEDVTRNMRSRGSRDSDQSRIWSDISAKAARMNVDSRTMAMSDLYTEQPLSQAVVDRAFTVKDNQIGYLAFVKGGFAGAATSSDPQPSVEKRCLN